MDLFMVAIIGVVVMIVLMLVFNMNVGLAMFIVGLFGIIICRSPEAAIGILRQSPSALSLTYAFTVIPMFVFMGNAAFKSGLSDGLFEFTNKWLSRFPGNFACASVAACAAFGAICGSAPATTATIGTVAIPKMRQAGYDTRLAVGSVAVGGGLGIMIPPSSPMIVYGIATESSVGRLFAAGIIPGLVLTGIIIIEIIIMLRIWPDRAPAGYKCSWKERFISLKGVAPIGVLFVIVLGGMFTGFFTASEAGAVGAAMSLILMIIKKAMNLKNLFSIIRDTVTTSGMIFLMLIGATLFGNFLTITQMPRVLAEAVGNLDVSRYVIFAIIIFVYFILGCIMDAVPMMLITLPVVFPIMMDLGFDPIWFGIIMIMVLELGIITPPVGLNCYVLAGIVKDVPLGTIFRGAVPFVFAILIAIIIVTAFPGLATWLPDMIYS